MVNRTLYLLIGMMFLFFSIIVGCSNEEASDESMSRDQAATDMNSEAGFVEEETAEVKETKEAPPSSDGDTSNSTQSLQEVDVSERMIIYNGDMVIQVENLDQAQEQVEEHVEQMGGYVVESSVHDRSEGERSGFLSVRIPQENFDTFLNELESTSTKVLERSTRGNDVTEEYIDLESRLRSKETVEERLLSFMEEAENTEDLLNISEDLSATQEEIERLKGRMNYLENHVAYATVNIRIHEKAVATLQDQDSLRTWAQAKGLFMDTVNAIISFFSGVAVFVIGLSPVLIPLLVIATGIVIFQKKRKNTKVNDK